MTTPVPADQAALRKPLRLWPGVAAVVLQWLIRFFIPVVLPSAVGFALLGGAAGSLVVLLWWLLFSRAPWFERLGALVLMGVGLFVASRLLHPSIATGAMGMLFPILAAPVLSLALVAGAVAGRKLSDGSRRAVMVAAILAGCGVWTLVKTGGFTGNFRNDLSWRWAKTPEERLLSQAAHQTMALPPTPSPTSKSPEWPGFRGAERNGTIHGLRIATNWSQSPPVQLWRWPIGPGWSSFAVNGAVFYTQEQRGQDEAVACYDLNSGQPVWRHLDHVRFWESNAGAGPRGTPTFSNGGLYTFGATGILNALDARTGALLWSRNVAADSNTKVPDWGFSSSPLVFENLVIVAASGKLLAYDLAAGALRWSGPAHGGSYSSPQQVTVGGVTQVLLLSDAGVTSVAPADGTVLWKYRWPGFTIVQPAVAANGDLLISTANAGGGLGLRRLTVTNAAGSWNVQERWTSPGLKPYFNDYVVHNGHAFGFDGSILACVDLQDGKRAWKGGRYGNGQLVLLSDQGLLLVLSEKGELALVGATPDQLNELGRFQAIQGKTWNHPALAGVILLVRNGQEMAAFRLPRG